MIKMKTISFALCLILTINWAIAESPTDKGVHTISGKGSYTRIEPEDEEAYTNLSIYPAYGYFILNNLSIGTRLEYTASRQDEYKHESIGIGPEVRYYIPIKKIYLFSSISYLYRESETGTSPSYMLEMEFNQLFLSIGLDFFISKNIAVEPQLSYSIYKNKYSRDTFKPFLGNDGRELSFEVGISIHVY